MQEFLNHRDIQKIGRYEGVTLSNLPEGVASELYLQMLRLRRTEEALIEEYHPADEMRCPVHFCVGQEAVPAALSLLLEPSDYLFSHHRTHGYYFGKNAPLGELFAELYGRSTGACGGLAGSQDISHCESRFYAGAILTGATCIATGAAFGLQLDGSREIAVAGFGEGATDEGAFWEAVAYAAHKKLPLLFVIENNRYATFSDQLGRQQADNICERVAPFGLRATKLFGNDAPLVYRTLSAEVERLREGDGPALVEAYTYRWNSHVGPEDDSANKYRTEEEQAFWRENCPLKLLGEALEKAGELDTGTREGLENEVAEEIESNFAFAKESPFPENADWEKLNNDYESPLADKLLKEGEAGHFDSYQAEAKLGPY